MDKKPILKDIPTLNILDGYSGTGNFVYPWTKSVSYNIKIDSVDILKLSHVNYCMDMREFILQKNFDFNQYHIMYFSPPCIHFSKIRKCNKKVKPTDKEDLKNALELVDIAFELGKKAKFCYIIENPLTGLLPKIYTKGFKEVHYSEYGFPMKKRTAIWSNIIDKFNFKVQKEVNYNRYSLHTMGKMERSAIPIGLSEYIKRIIIREFNEPLQEFKIPGFEKP